MKRLTIILVCILSSLCFGQMRGRYSPNSWQVSPDGTYIYLLDNQNVRFYDTGGLLATMSSDSTTAWMLKDSGGATDLVWNSTNGRFGFFTSAPDRAIEENLGTSGYHRITYNDSNGSATNYAEWTISSDGAWTLTTVDSDGAVGHLVFDPDGVVKVGAGTPGSATSPDDMYVTGKLEVDGILYSDGNLWVAGNFYTLVGGASCGGFVGYPDDGWHMFPRDSDGTGNKAIVITTYSNKDKDHDHDTLLTNPTLFIHSTTDPDTNNTQWMSLSHNQTNGVIAVGTGAIISGSVTAGIAATNPGAQGDSALTSNINEVATVGTADDAVTLPSAVAGLRIVIINNGVNQLEIWPASGDNAGAGVNTAVTLAAGSNIEYVAYDATNWEALR